MNLASVDPGPIDVARMRRDTPTCFGQAFLDNAGSALPTSIALETTVAHLRLESDVGGYAAQNEALGRISQTLGALGRLVGVSRDHIALQTSATAAWTRAVQAIEFKPGDRILTTNAEYASNILPLLQLVQRTGVTLEFLPDGSDGVADPASISEMMDERVKLLAITHAPSQNGLLVDAAAIGTALRSTGSDAWYLLDACQSVGQLPIDLTTIGCDLLAATGRKFLRAPRGTGFLAFSDRALGELQPTPPDMYGSHWNGADGYSSEPDASRFQSFEMSYAGVLGMGAAAEYALAQGLPQIRQRINYLATRLRGVIEASVPNVQVLDRGAEKSGIVVFSCPGDDPVALTQRLRVSGITLSPMSAPTNPKHYASYRSTCVLRASPHIYNTDDDLNVLAQALRVAQP